MGRSIDFRVIAFDDASRKFREIGDEALKMAAEVRASNADTANSHALAGLAAYKHAKAFNAAARDIEKDASKVENRVKTAWGELIKANDNLDRSLVRMWQRSNPLMKAFLFMAPMLPPLLNSAAMAAGALGSAVVSAGFGLGVLAAGLKANLSLWAEARGFANKKTGKIEWNKVPEIAAFAKDTQPLAFQTFDTLLKSLQILLPRVTPIFVAFASRFIEFLHGINSDMQGPGFKQFLDWVRTVGSYNFGNILTSVKNIAVGLGHLAMDFSGQGMGLTKWLADITGKFAHWAKVLPNTAGWKSFLNMFSQDGPLIRDIFKQLADLLPKILGALAPLSHMTLTALDDLLKFANRLKPSTIDNIVKSLVALKLAMTALSIASKGKSILALIGIGGGEAGAAGGAGALASAGPWVVAFALAIAGLAVAYNHAQKSSAWFRRDQRLQGQEFQKLGGDVRTFGHWLEGLYPTFNKVNEAGTRFWTFLGRVATFAIATLIVKFAQLVRSIGQFLVAIGHIPGFHWALTAGQWMERAANSALNLARAIAGIHSKTVTVTTQFVSYQTTVSTLIQQRRTVGTYGMVRAAAMVRRAPVRRPPPRRAAPPPRRNARLLRRHATGGRPEVGRPSWVGEEGPELFIPDNPGRIVPHRQSMKMAGGGDDLAKAIARALNGAELILVDPDGHGRRSYLLTGKSR